MEVGPSGALGANVAGTAAQVSETANAPAPTPNPNMEESPASGLPRSFRSAILHHVQVSHIYTSYSIYTFSVTFTSYTASPSIGVVTVSCLK